MGRAWRAVQDMPRGIRIKCYSNKCFRSEARRADGGGWPEESAACPRPES